MNLIRILYPSLNLNLSRIKDLSSYKSLHINPRSKPKKVTVITNLRHISNNKE